MSDNVKSPAHYTEGRKYEPKDVIRDWGLNFNLGSAVKYLSRAGRKDDIVQDLKKAREFIQFEIDAIEQVEAEERAHLMSEQYPNTSFMDWLTDKQRFMVELREEMEAELRASELADMFRNAVMKLVNEHGVDIHSIKAVTIGSGDGGDE